MDDTARMVLAVKMTALKAYIGGGMVKTEGTYYRQGWRSTREFYNGEIGPMEFIDDFFGYIDNQFDRAWRAGARDVNVDHRTFTDDDLWHMEVRKEAEKQHVLKLAEDIERARLNGEPLDQFRGRIEMWAHRYDEVQNEARAHFGGRQLLEWVMGATMEHCSDCLRLTGAVATAEEWAASGWLPQSRNLECGGYNCQCSLQLTDKPPTGIP
jgi:hypothetical protein